MVVVLRPAGARHRTVKEWVAHEVRQQRRIDLARRGDRAVPVIRQAVELLAQIVAHDVARAGIEAEHLAAIRERDVQVCNAADVERHGRTRLLAEQDEVQIGHQRRRRAAPCVVSRTEVRHRVDIGQVRDDRRVTHLCTGGVFAGKPAADPVRLFLRRHFRDRCVVRLLLINGLCIQTEHLDLRRLQPVLLHKACGRLGKHRAAQIIQSVQANHVNLVFKRVAHNGRNRLRPVVGCAPQEFRSLWKTVRVQFRFGKDDVDAVEGRTAVHAHDQIHLYIPPFLLFLHR